MIEYMLPALYVVLGLAQGAATVGLQEIVGWPLISCMLVAGLTGWTNLVGTLTGAWDAHAAWVLGWLPSFELFLAMETFVAFVALGALSVHCFRRHKNQRLAAGSGSL